MSRHYIRQVHLSVFDLLDRVHLRLEITHVVHLLTQLLHTDRRQLLVIHHRRFTHLERVMRQTLLALRCRVFRRRVVDVQLQLPEP